MSPALEVVRTGPLALLEDAGRPGWASVGVGRSGAADRSAYRLACRLVGHDDHPAVLEVLLGGLVVRARGALTVALAGAPAPARVDGRAVAHRGVVHLPDGAELSLGTPASGLRTYLAVRGGLAVEPVLGSRSTDTLSGVGPPPVAPGDVLPVGPAPRAFPVVDAAPPSAPEAGPAVLDLLPGPRAAWVGGTDVLTGPGWTVGADSDRVGVRLAPVDGPAVERAEAFRDAELPSEGMVRGAVQLPPGGEPVVVLADHPVTGGYPVVAVLTEGSADRAAQLRPGERVRLRAARP
ncbi:biotin-dependent carboxyltransferase family protein [Phycicoccus sonneratiae]|uniref:Biotin-dependent carboxyltransferase family protein n=1 Tax=Phycicoccus sonneratiae TaxID=2807628 RepID=A0ABS2CH94_9MICO|nr:biotin-dependent carboxyltransferase family protein [Phycicoccus sonneraticus]MBM6399239.1 biotin-dependent carboxyltransferase family protein [Phycicoccus sonneraticus]